MVHGLQHSKWRWMERSKWRNMHCWTEKQTFVLWCPPWYFHGVGCHRSTWKSPFQLESKFNRKSRNQPIWKSFYILLKRRQSTSRISSHWFRKWNYASNVRIEWFTRKRKSSVPKRSKLTNGRFTTIFSHYLIIFIISFTKLRFRGSFWGAKQK